MCIQKGSTIFQDVNKTVCKNTQINMQYALLRPYRALSKRAEALYLSTYHFDLIQSIRTRILYPLSHDITSNSSCTHASQFIGITQERAKNRASRPHKWMTIFLIHIETAGRRHSSHSALCLALKCILWLKLGLANYPVRSRKIEITTSISDLRTQNLDQHAPWDLRSGPERFVQPFGATTCPRNPNPNPF